MVELSQMVELSKMRLPWAKKSEVVSDLLSMVELVELPPLELLPAFPPKERCPEMLLLDRPPLEVVAP